MTLDEAIKRLKEARSTIQPFRYVDEAIDYAIKALEQQPCEDAISRVDAIRIASGYCHYTNIPDELAKLPSVNPKPCEDAISKQAAIDAIENTKSAKSEDGEIYVAKINAEMNIQLLPSVSTEKTGRWIPVSERLPEDDCKTYLVCTDDGYIATIIYDRSMGWLLSANIVAWMPLPQPYEPQESEVQDADSD